jgi:hypothetical protein
MDDKQMDHEIRIRLLEESLKDMKHLLYWIVGLGITSIIIPIFLHKLGV